MVRRSPYSASKTSLPVVNVVWIHPFLEILDETGGSSEEVLDAADLPVLAINDGSILVPTEKIYRFVELADEITQLPDLGLRAGCRLDLELLLPSPEEMWKQPGVFRSLESFIQTALDSSSNVDMWLEPRPDQERALEFFYSGTFDSDHPAFPTVEQFMLTVMVRWVRWGAGPKLNLLQVNMRARTAPMEELHQLVGGARILSNQRATSIVIPSDQFGGSRQEIPQKDTEIWRRNRESLERSSWSEDLAGSLRMVLPAYLPDGSPDIQLAARLTGNSVRTFQRRLKEQGLSFSRLLEDLRHDLSIFHLRHSNLQIAEISRELGYRDPAIFTRAFRRWTGKTPSEFRARFIE